MQPEEETEEKSHDDISCNMVSMCDNLTDFNSKEPKNDITSQRIAYHLHH